MGMICFAKSGLIEDLYIVYKEEFLIICYTIRTLEKRPSIFIRDRPIFSSETMLHKDYDGNGSVPKKKKNCNREPQYVWLQGELIGGKPLVVK
jgi:hypothetical protein